MLSVIIISKNEEANIKRCLESVSFADEIVVLDSGSTDKTIEIAQKYTENVYTSEDWYGYGVQKQRALNLATGDWVLNLDADESVSEHLRTAIEEAMESDEADAYRIPICMNFYGKPLRYSSSPTRHIRLFKREGARYSDDIVHEKIILPAEARISKLTLPIMHHSFRDVSHALYKINRYTSYSAKIRSQKGDPPGIVKILFSTGWMFFRCFYLQRGFMDGVAGFLLAVFNAQGTFYRGIKQLYPDVRHTISMSPDRKDIQAVPSLPDKSADEVEDKPLPQEQLTTESESIIEVTEPNQEATDNDEKLPVEEVIEHDAFLQREQDEPLEEDVIEPEDIFEEEEAIEQDKLLVNKQSSEEK
ncbi:lipopolysaccharide biosynthesis glycosyltransferase [Legionella beliardensis]|uniref:Lipopolysaccharide biosynthesis glycosyltransferase n=1 Tax=Legionella beliardensis TaxID=91822 RepID=A0A378HZL7_9GAMM|nr:glycosyltransferase family 2 protein [Legionella beliardensis]STX28367.1 lipopolysaccharide biosynthesis glycosyltransferase [Legionella beliardensis]